MPFARPPTELFDGVNPNIGVAVSSTNSYYSNRLDCDEASRAGLHLTWTGTPTGTLTVWSTNNPDAATGSDTGWIQETGVTVPSQPAGSASGTMIHVFENGARWLRVKYVNASGSGNLRGMAWTKA